MYGYMGLYFKTTDEENIKYQQFYCGMCHELKKNFGNIYRLTIVREVTLFAMMENEINDDKTIVCPWVGFKKRHIPLNVNLEKYSYLNVLIMYGKLLDYKSEGVMLPKMYLSGLRKKLSAYYGEEFIRGYEDILKTQDEVEKHHLDIDDYAKPSADIMAYISRNMFEDTEEWELFSRAAGTLVYHVDCIDDFEKDLKKNKFNGIRNSFNITDITKLSQEDRERLLFTYDYCSKVVAETAEKFTRCNKELVMKVLKHSIIFHRKRITESLLGIKTKEKETGGVMK